MDLEVLWSICFPWSYLNILWYLKDKVVCPYNITRDLFLWKFYMCMYVCMYLCVHRYMYITTAMTLTFYVHIPYTYMFIYIHTCTHMAYICMPSVYIHTYTHRVKQSSNVLWKTATSTKLLSIYLPSLWLIIGKIDAEAEAPIIWPADAKSQLTGKSPNSGKGWRQQKGVTEDEMVR